MSTKQLKSNRWRLVSPAGQYAGIGDRLQATLVSREQAQVFDGRDNPEAKARFYGMLLRVPFSVEIESCVS